MKEYNHRPPTEPVQPVGAASDEALSEFFRFSSQPILPVQEGEPPLPPTGKSADGIKFPSEKSLPTGDEFNRSSSTQESPTSPLKMQRLLQQAFTNDLAGSAPGTGSLVNDKDATTPPAFPSSTFSRVSMSGSSGSSQEAIGQILEQFSSFNQGDPSQITVNGGGHPGKEVAFRADASNLIPGNPLAAEASSLSSPLPGTAPIPMGAGMAVQPPSGAGPGSSMGVVIPPGNLVFAAPGKEPSSRGAGARSWLMGGLASIGLGALLLFSSDARSAAIVMALGFGIVLVSLVCVLVSSRKS